MALAQQLVPLLIDPGLDTSEQFLGSRLEQVGKAPLPLQPRRQRLFVVGTVGETILTLLVLEQGPVAGVDSLARQIDALCAFRAPAARTRRQDVQERGPIDGEGLGRLAHQVAWIVRRGLGHIVDAVSDHYLGSFLRCSSLPAVSSPTGLVVGPGGYGRGPGALKAGVHVGAVVVADIEHAVAAVHRSGERLEADVVGAPVPAEGDELDVLVDEALLLQGAKSGLHAAQRGGGVLEGGVDEAALPGGVRIDGRAHLQTAGGGTDHHRVTGAHEHLTHHCGRPAAGAHAMSPGQAAALGDQLQPPQARLLEMVGLGESVYRTHVYALPAHDAATLVEEGVQHALIESERPVGQVVTQRPQEMHFDSWRLSP